MRTFQIKNRDRVVDGVVFPDGAIALRGRGVECYTMTFDGLEEAESELSVWMADELARAVAPAAYVPEPDDYEDPARQAAVSP